jgi:hypothetical protein
MSEILYIEHPIILSAACFSLVVTIESSHGKIQVLLEKNKKKEEIRVVISPFLFLFSNRSNNKITTCRVFNNEEETKSTRNCAVLTQLLKKKL